MSAATDDTSRFAGIKSLCGGIQKVINLIIILLMIAMTVIMFAQVVMRTSGAQSFIWAEEVLRFMFIWVVFLGMPTAIFYNELSRFDMLQEFLSNGPKKVLETLIYIVVGVILYWTTTGVFKIIARQMKQNATSLPIPMGLVYAIIPVCSVIGIFYLAVKIYLMWAGDTDLVKPVDTLKETVEHLEAEGDL